MGSIRVRITSARVYRWRFETGVFALLPVIIMTSALLILIGLLVPFVMKYATYAFAAMLLAQITRFWP
jgi:hypothetical protein